MRLAGQAGQASVETVAVLPAVILAAAAAWVLHRRGHLRRVLAFLAPMAEATRNLRSNHGAQLLGITFVVWALEWIAWWLTARAVGLVRRKNCPELGRRYAVLKR